MAAKWGHLGMSVPDIAQVLAAEKAGCWSAALTLYEQALKNEADSAAAAADGRPVRAGDGGRPGPEGQRLSGSLAKGHLSVAQRGHLNCLLQLGHLQALLAEVDGWASRCTGLLSCFSPASYSQSCCAVCDLEDSDPEYISHDVTSLCFNG